jgi:hypothetical protein
MSLVFVDPAEPVTSYGVILWAAGGQGKTVRACSAPAPILALSADRKNAYKVARRAYPDKQIREVRFVDVFTLTKVEQHVADPANGIRTVIVDPVGNVYDQLVASVTPRDDGEPDYQKVNLRLLAFVKALRDLDVNVVLVAHETINDSRGADGKTYPALGGPKVINRLVAEMDIVAHVERELAEDGPVWVGQLQPRGDLVCKEAFDALGERRPVDLTEWFDTCGAKHGALPAVEDLGAVGQHAERVATEKPKPKPRSRPKPTRSKP